MKDIAKRVGRRLQNADFFRVKPGMFVDGGILVIDVQHRTVGSPRTVDRRNVIEAVLLGSLHNPEVGDLAPDLMRAGTRAEAFAATLEFVEDWERKSKQALLFPSDGYNVREAIREARLVRVSDPQAMILAIERLLDVLAI